jgi:hypothetical protein
MQRLAVLGASSLLWLAGCGSGSHAESAATPKPLTPEASQAIDDSIAALVTGYKAGRLARDEAAQLLANLIEPLPGFAAQTDDSVALDLFQATQPILRERMAARYSLPDSVP